ncbi:hypothetical protein ASD78_09395 [Lysobacter sp. Root667]|nr:hypothetical protein ASD78_09395 [Lysobacter sp. Root667]
MPAWPESSTESEPRRASADNFDSASLRADIAGGTVERALPGREQSVRLQSDREGLEIRQPG